jgi:hypothetical protein
MTRSATLVFLLGLALAVGAQNPSIDREKLELLRKMSPEERAQLRAKLEEIKKLPAEERSRLRENLKKINAMPAEEVKNLKEKARHLSREEQKEYSELAGGFFRWAHRMGYSEAFPRGLFFTWLKNERPEKMQEIREMEPGVGSRRVDEFVKLFYEFRDATLVRTEQHVARHKCMSPDAVHELRDASPKDFWPRWSELTRSCSSRKSNPGPVPPYPPETQKK